MTCCTYKETLANTVVGLGLKQLVCTTYSLGFRTKLKTVTENLQASDQTPLCNSISDQDVGEATQVLASINDLADHRGTKCSYQTIFL